jgi:hypothetical protein
MSALKLVFAAVALPPFWAGLDIGFGHWFGYEHGYLDLADLLKSFVLMLCNNDQHVATSILILWVGLSFGLILGNLFGLFNKSK